MIQIRYLFTLTAACSIAVPSAAEKQEEFIMPRMQQNTYLSHAKDPAQFGFRTTQTANGTLLQDANARLHRGQTVQLQLSEKQIPVFTLRGRSQRMKTMALLDTSSPTSWMEFSTSQKFAATFLGTDSYKLPYNGKYNIGKASAYAAVISTLRIDSLRIENTPVYVRMALHSLGPLARGITSPDIGAVIGYDVLKEFEYIQFNSHDRTLELSSTDAYTPNAELLMSEAKIVTLKDHGLAVEGALLGEPAPIVLDFAGDYHFSRGDVKVNVTKQISLGDVVFRKVPTLLLPTYDAPPRAGRRLLENYIITICPKKSVVYFERFPE
ncbi:hypothetical protein P4B35_12885 [Pontiellaceae bacterium B12227]|nr:hypothetical protein [Pontiellaceae bacterium B12227]